MTRVKMVFSSTVVAGFLACLLAGNALALPEFITRSGGNQTFAGISTTGGRLTGRSLGNEGYLSCEKVSVSGFILTKSMEMTNVVIELSGKCELNLGSTKSTCAEPVVTKELTGTLGYVKEEAKGAVGLLLKPASGSVVFGFSCGGSVNDLSGEVVGEFSTAQLNKMQTGFTLTFAATGVKQAVKTFLLLPTSFMTGVHLNWTGFFGGEGSMSWTGELTTPEMEIKA